MKFERLSGGIVPPDVKLDLFSLMILKYYEMYKFELPSLQSHQFNNCSKQASAKMREMNVESLVTLPSHLHRGSICTRSIVAHEAVGPRIVPEKERPKVTAVIIPPGPRQLRGRPQLASSRVGALGSSPKNTLINKAGNFTIGRCGFLSDECGVQLHLSRFCW